MEDKLVSFSDLDGFSPFFSGVDGILSDSSFPDVLRVELFEFLELSKLALR